MIPEDRHQGENKISLVKRFSFTVNMDKNFRHLLLGKLQYCEGKIQEVLKTGERILYPFFFIGCQFTDSCQIFKIVGNKIKNVSLFGPNK